MTKSETLSNLKAYLDGDTAIGNIIPLRSVLESAIKYLEPSLPSNLDEAANEEADELLAYMKIDGDMIYLPTAKALMIALARFGAQWMAEQGETVEGVFKAGDPGYPDVRMGEQYSIEHILRKPGGIEPGDEVIVQIRKKYDL